MADLQAVEARIWSLLEPYRGELEAATIYGLPSLRWPGGRAHDYFASVRAGKSSVSLYLLVADTYAEVFEAAPEALRTRRSGKATFTFPSLDDRMAQEPGGAAGTPLRAVPCRPRHRLSSVMSSRSLRRSCSYGSMGPK